MSIDGRIEALKRKHKDLDDRIEVLQAERAPEHFITNLKREKLAIKDELARIQNA